MLCQLFCISQSNLADTETNLEQFYMHFTHTVSVCSMLDVLFPEYHISPIYVLKQYMSFYTVCETMQEKKPIIVSSKTYVKIYIYTHTVNPHLKDYSEITTSSLLRLYTGTHRPVPQFHSIFKLIHETTFLLRPIFIQSQYWSFYRGFTAQCNLHNTTITESEDKLS